jgi:hypothetical protein
LIRRRQRPKILGLEGGIMLSRFPLLLVPFVLLTSLAAGAQNAAPPPAQSGGDFSTNTHPTEEQKVPKNVILVKGAWASASDSVTPLPEGGSIATNVYSNKYFGLAFPLPQDWFQKFPGPPPSDSGRYVLAHLRTAETYKGPARGSILLTADDMFFTLLPASNSLELVNYTVNHLQADYKMEIKPTETKIGGRSFTFYAYWSPVAEMHWYVLATQIRCHTVEIVMTSRDTKLLGSLLLDMNKLKLAAEAGPALGTGGGDFPACIKNYATPQNLIERVEPVLTDRKFNPIPVRIIINKEGRVKHVHFLSAFPDQAKAVEDAVMQWRFKPYLRDGQPLEVETGIMFGNARQLLPTTAAKPATNVTN